MKCFAAVMLVFLCALLAAPVWGQFGPGVIDAPNGDPFWLPTEKQLQAWANDGINVALADTPILKAPGVWKWMWSNADGNPCGGSSLVGAVVLAPELALTAAGYWSAGGDVARDRIRLNQASVAIDVAQNVRYDLFGGQIQFVFGLVSEGDEQPDPLGMVWYGNQWRPMQISGGSSASALLDGPQFGQRGWGWLGGYLLAQSLSQESKLDMDRVWVMYGSMPLHPRTGPDPSFASAVPTPRGNDIRVAIGLPRQYAYVDF